MVEMDNAHCGWRSKKAATRLDLPAPEGAAIISSRQAVNGRSLKVLGLFPNLLDQQLHFDGDVA